MLSRAFETAARTGHRSRPLGFTLIELVVTISLLGILMALGLPSFNAWVQNSKVRAVTDSLQTGARLAQAEAVRRNRQMVLTLTNAQPALNATAVANGTNWSVQSVAQFGEVAAFVQGGALADVASSVTITGPASICFNSNGRLVANASPGPSGASCSAGIATYDFAHPKADRNLRVIVQVAGQVRLCDPKRPTLSDTSPDGCP